MKWEYKILTRDDPCPDSKKELNILGRDGWELVAIRRIYKLGLKWYFKRLLTTRKK